MRNSMFDKIPRIWIKGQNFMPSKVVEQIRMQYGDVFNEVELKINSNSKHMWISCPKSIKKCHDCKDESDIRISWLLDYVEDKIELFKRFGADEIVLDIEYNFEIENRSQRYTDCLSTYQMKKMAEIGIKYEITIWPMDKIL